jgi:hypothetical protein
MSLNSGADPGTVKVLTEMQPGKKVMLRLLLRLLHLASQLQTAATSPSLQAASPSTSRCCMQELKPRSSQR